LKFDDDSAVPTKINDAISPLTFRWGGIFQLSARHVGFLAIDGFGQAELKEPFSALRSLGASPRILSEKVGQIQGFHHDEKANKFAVDGTFSACGASEFDALVLPGGVLNADQIRTNSQAQ
jgi:protease I